MKKSIEKTVSLLLAVIMLVCAVPFAASASDQYTEGCFTFIVNGWNEAEILDCDESVSGALIIPATLGGYPVTSILHGAFQICDSITSITIPKSVKNMINNPFAGCISLEEIIVEEGNEDYCLIDGVLFEIDEVGSIILKCYPAAKKGQIYNIPNNTFAVGDEAFVCCRELKTVTFPKEKVLIGDAVFSSSSIETIAWPENIPNIGRGVFSSCQSLKNVTIPEGVTDLGEAAFYGCTSLESIKLPNSLTSIGRYAFAFCTVLKTIDIPNSVTTIGESAFGYCFKLGNVSFGNNVEKIDNSAFAFSGIESVNIPGTVKSIEDGSFSYTGQLKNVTLSEGIEEIGKGAFTFSAYDSINIPSSVKSIGASAFSCCWNLKSIDVNPDNTNYCAIDGVLFDKDVSSLNSYPTGKEDTFYKVPDSVTSFIDVNVANNLKQIMFPKNVKLYETITTDKGTSEMAGAMFGISIIPFSFTGTTMDEFTDYASVYQQLSFNAIENFTVYGYAGTDAEKYANENNFTFVDLSGEHTHSFSEWTVTTEPTCTTEGEETRTCSVCNVTETRDVAALEHDYKHITKSATCKETGFEKDVCSRCGDEINYNELPLAPHTFSAWTVTTEPTCTAEGEETRTCSVCGLAETRKLEKIDHVLVPITVPSTCKVQGVSYEACDMCGETFNYTVLPLAPHTFGNWTVTKEAKCETAGEETRTCSVCNVTETRDVAALGHDYKHITKSATCKETGFEKDVCSRCGNEINYNELPLAPHTFSAWTVTTEPTCTAEGEETRTCSGCGLAETRKLEKINHVLVPITVPSTCKVQGVSYEACDMCGETFNYTVLPFAPHTFGEWTVTKEAKCETAGEETRTCSVCNVTETRDVAALGHDYKHITKSATCKETGFEKDVCSRCGNEINYNELPLAPHTFGEWITTKEASVFESGEKVRICSVCSFEEKETIEKIKAEEVNDEKTGISVICPDGSYDGKVEIQVTETFDGESYQLLNAERGNYKNALFDITTVVDGKKVQPNGSVWVKIPLPKGYNAEKTFVYHITNSGKLEKVESRVEGGYIIFETTHFSYYAIVDESSSVNPSQSCSCNCHKKGIVHFFFKIALFFQKIFKKNKTCLCGVNHY